MIRYGEISLLLQILVYTLYHTVVHYISNDERGTQQTNTYIYICIHQTCDSDFHNEIPLDILSTSLSKTDAHLLYCFVVENIM